MIICNRGGDTVEFCRKPFGCINVYVAEKLRENLHQERSISRNVYTPANKLYRPLLKTFDIFKVMDRDT